MAKPIIIIKKGKYLDVVSLVNKAMEQRIKTGTIIINHIFTSLFLKLMSTLSANFLIPCKNFLMFSLISCCSIYTIGTLGSFMGFLLCIIYLE